MTGRSGLESRHKEWRAQAKKMRRKKIRQLKAQERDSLLEEVMSFHSGRKQCARAGMFVDKTSHTQTEKRGTFERKMQENSPRYQAWEQEQQVLEEFEREEEERLNWERNVQWVRDEEVAQRQWRERQVKLALAREEKTKQELRIREEWESEQNKLRVAEEIELKKKEEKQRQQSSEKAAAYLLDKEGDRENKERSQGFYSHFGIQNFLQDEYDTDIMLEYEDSETYQHFKEFFDDVLLEFERFGRVVQFKVCRNFEPHLRGNVYVEYASTQDAVAAFQKFQGRWYGGRQLNVEFTSVPSWRNAICGLFFKARCPKGKGCNFLHVFRNPNNAFANADLDHGSSWRKKWNRSRSKSPSRSPRARNKNTPNNWRWSESPERESTPRNENSNRKSRRSHRDNNSSSHRSRLDSARKSAPKSKHHSVSVLSDRSQRGESEGKREKKGSQDKDPNSHRKEKRRKHSHSCTRVQDDCEFPVHGLPGDGGVPEGWVWDQVAQLQFQGLSNGKARGKGECCNPIDIGQGHWNFSSFACCFQAASPKLRKLDRLGWCSVGHPPQAAAPGGQQPGSPSPQATPALHYYLNDFVSHLHTQFLSATAQRIC
uniref:(California timema) hypothetical protein n=1 Tax=Timema californicum TaxID=61474 RepID=A0A7R9JAW9_TIMCA|nr:unnamed protein product [Timema californicum]